MPSYLKPFVLLAALLGSNALSVPCQHGKAQALLGEPDDDTAWVIAAYPELNCGGTAAPDSGKGETGCMSISKSQSEYLSYRYWGNGTLKACFYSAPGCQAGSLIDASTGSHEMQCFPFANFEPAIALSIISATSACIA